MSQIAEVIVAREALLEQRYHHATNLEQEFKTLKDERASLQEAYHALHRRHVLLENAINALNGSIESARNDNENLHRMIGDLSRSAISTENEVKEKNATLFSLQQERTKLLERRDSLEQELQTLRAQLDRSATEIAALSDELSRSTGELEKLREMVSLFHVKSGHAGNQIAQLRNESMELDHAKSGVSRRIMILQENYEKETKQISDLIASIEDAKILISNKQMEEQSMIKSLGLLRNKMSESLSHSKALQERIGALNVQENMLHMEIRNTREKCETAEKNASALQGQVKKAEEKLSQKQSQLQVDKERIQSLLQQDDSLRKMISKQHQQLKIIEDDICEIQQKLEKRHRVNETRKKESQIIESRLIERKSAMEDLQRQLSALNAVIAEKEKVVQDLCKEEQQIEEMIFQEKELLKRHKSTFESVSQREHKHIATIEEKRAALSQLEAESSKIKVMNHTEVHLSTRKNSAGCEKWENTFEYQDSPNSGVSTIPAVVPGRKSRSLSRSSSARNVSAPISERAKEDDQIEPRGVAEDISTVRNGRTTNFLSSLVGSNGSNTGSSVGSSVGHDTRVNRPYPMQGSTTPGNPLHMRNKAQSISPGRLHGTKPQGHVVVPERSPYRPNRMNLHSFADDDAIMLFSALTQDSRSEQCNGTKTAKHARKQNQQHAPPKRMMSPASVSTSARAVTSVTPHHSRQLLTTPTAINTPDIQKSMLSSMTPASSIGTSSKGKEQYLISDRKRMRKELMAEVHGIQQIHSFPIGERGSTKQEELVRANKKLKLTTANRKQFAYDSGSSWSSSNSTETANYEANSPEKPLYTSTITDIFDNDLFF